MAAGVQTLWAQRVVLYKTNSQTIECEVSDLDSIAFIEKVAILVTKIELSATSITLHPGETKTITATALPNNADIKALTWKSSNENVATVNQKGKVTAVAIGSSIITAIATDGSGVKATCAVTVEREWVDLGLPVSTMISPETQWTADIMVFKKTEGYVRDNIQANGVVIDAPPIDYNGNKWYAQDYKLTNSQASWSVGYSPFLSEVFDALTEKIPWVIWDNSTRWSTGEDVADIYLRRTFTLDHELSDKVFLSCCHDDNAEWYLNGVLIYSVEGYNWEYDDSNEKVYLTPEQRALIHTDGRKNVLAIHTHNYGGPALADGGLYDEEIGLPTSTMVSPKIQWAADMMVFNDADRWHTDADGLVIDTPPSDTRGNKWYAQNYQLTNGQKSWSIGYSPFLSEEENIEISWVLWPTSTRWSTGNDVADIYLRRTFTVNRELSGKIYLSYCHDDGAEWYLNGVLIHSTGVEDWSYDKEGKIYLTPEQCALIHTDGSDNVLAIHVHNFGGPALADGGLYEEDDSE